MFRVTVITFLFVSILLSAGCASPDEAVTPAPTEFVSPIVTPLNTALDSPVPTPEAVFVPTPLPVPAEGRGSVTGRLIDQLSGQKVTGLYVYLGDVGDVVMIQQNSSPHVIPDVEGYFALTDVEPKEYALILWAPHNSVVVNGPDGSTFTVEVQAGQVTDIGELVVTLP